MDREREYLARADQVELEAGAMTSETAKQIMLETAGRWRAMATEIAGEIRNGRTADARDEPTLVGIEVTFRFDYLGREKAEVSPRTEPSVARLLSRPGAASQRSEIRRIGAPPPVSGWLEPFG